MVQTRSQPSRPPKPEIAGDAGGVVFLGGGLQLPPLARNLSSPVLSLPQTPRSCVFDVWLQALAGIGADSGRVLVLTDSDGATKWRNSSCDASLILDNAAYRGPAGVLRDASASLDDDGPRVVIEHTRLLTSPDLMSELVRSHASGPQAITLALNPDQSFAGILIADKPAIDLIPSIGFMDIKEQWLPAASRNGFVVERVMLSNWCHQIRTLSGYLGALSGIGAFERAPGQCVLGRGDSALEPIEYGAALASETATVDPTAILARSVVGAEARVGPGAVVVRSVVPRGATVPRNGVVIDAIASPAGDSVGSMRGGRS